MATMTGTSTDKRVDHLRSEMHRGFAQVDQRFDRVEADIRELRADNRMLRAEMSDGFHVMQASLTSIHRMMVGFFATTLGSIIAGIVVLLASHS